MCSFPWLPVALFASRSAFYAPCLHVRLPCVFGELDAFRATRLAINGILGCPLLFGDGHMLETSHTRTDSARSVLDGTARLWPVSVDTEAATTAMETTGLAQSGTERGDT